MRACIFLFTPSIHARTNIRPPTGLGAARPPQSRARGVGNHIRPGAEHSANPTEPSLTCNPVQPSPPGGGGVRLYLQSHCTAAMASICCSSHVTPSCTVPVVVYKCPLFILNCLLLAALHRQYYIHTYIHTLVTTCRLPRLGTSSMHMQLLYMILIAPRHSGKDHPYPDELGISEQQK